jgi:hypothetical protein
MCGTHTATARAPKHYCAETSKQYRCPTCHTSGLSGSMCPTHTATALVEVDVPHGFVATTGCTVHAEKRHVCGFHDASGACAENHQNNEPCGSYPTWGICREGLARPAADACEYYPKGGACSKGHKATEACGLYDATGDCQQTPAKPELCNQFYASTGTCTRPPSTPKVCGATLAPMGTAVTPLVSVIAVPKSQIATHFQKYGTLTIYPAHDLPALRVV